MPREPGSTRICLLGPPIEHRESILTAVRTFASEVTWLPDLGTYLRSHGKRRSGARRFIDMTHGIGNTSYLDLLKSEIERVKPSLVIAYWGTLPLSEIRTLRCSYPDIKIALVMLCYPLGLSTGEILRQHLALRSVTRFIDAIVCPTNDMVVYLQQRVLGKNPPHLHVVQPCWPKGMLASERPLPAMEAPNLIFAGRTDMQSKNFQKGDDVRASLQEILDAGLHLYHASSSTAFAPHPKRHAFTPLGVTGLINGMAAYDASLIMYNLDACRRRERFDLTVPDRLISSVAAGVPIAISREGYSASKSYLRRYGAMIEFSDWNDLYRKLADRGRVRAAKQQAWENRLYYTAENSGAEYEALAGTIL